MVHNRSAYNKAAVTTSGTWSVIPTKQEQKQTPLEKHIQLD